MLNGAGESGTAATGGGRRDGAYHSDGKRRPLAPDGGCIGFGLKPKRYLLPDLILPWYLSISGNLYRHEQALSLPAHA